MMVTRVHEEVSIPAAQASLTGNLMIPLKARSIVIFSHGSGSSRFSRRNMAVSEYLYKLNFGTLLFDLLTEEEDMIAENRFDIDLLSQRLIDASTWLMKQESAKDCRLGYFGASTGAASALKAAAQMNSISAIVSRGGRPDLAGDALEKVKAPTLLIVGGLDLDVLQLNREAFTHLKCKKQLQVVKGATHLFEEAGKMKEVCELAGNWFSRHMG